MDSLGNTGEKGDMNDTCGVLKSHGWVPLPGWVIGCLSLFQDTPTLKMHPSFPTPIERKLDLVL